MVSFGVSAKEVAGGRTSGARALLAALQGVGEGGWRIICRV